MKFFYNGKLVRTSKNHVYTHAVMDRATGGFKGCRSTREAAQALISAEIGRYRADIKRCHTAIQALEAGKPYYMVKERGYSYKVYFARLENPTREWFQKIIADEERYIAYLEQNWIVVELEAREK